MHAMDGPKLAEYLDALPGGLDAHPTCMCKASLIREMIDDELPEVVEALHRLPAPLASLVREPPLDTTWIPEVHMAAIFLAIADASPVSEEVMLERAREVNRRLFASPMYRALGALMRPDRLLRYSGGVWKRWHQGSELHWGARRGDEMRGWIRFPDHLMPAMLARAIGTSFEALSDLGGPDAVCEVTSVTKNEAHFTVRWL